MACSGENTCSLDCIVKVWGAADEMCTFGSLVSEGGAHGPLLPCMDLLNIANIWNVSPFDANQKMNAAICSHTYQMKIQTQLVEWMDLSLKWHYGPHCIRKKFAVGSSNDHTLLPIQEWQWRTAKRSHYNFGYVSTVTQGLDGPSERNGSCKVPDPSI